MKENTKFKHLTLESRITIQFELDKGTAICKIADVLEKNKSTISKEIKRNLTVKSPSVKRFTEEKTPIAEQCPKLLKPPYVCNGCQNRHKNCVYVKHLYLANKAQEQYELTLCDSRTGCPLNKSSFYEIDGIVSNGIKKGQHLYHIIKTHSLDVSQATVYRYLKLGYLSVSAVDFPRVVKFKPRKSRYLEYVPQNLKKGRTYSDFTEYIQKNSIEHWVELDTVIGRVGGKCIMTLNFTSCNFIVGLLLDNKSSSEVSDKMDKLKKLFFDNNIDFSEIFPLLLTDNGGEFANIDNITLNIHTKKSSELFFCDPMKSCQKPRIEKNHTLFRDILPKGTSFDNLNQLDINLVFSHINNVYRASAHGKTAYDVFTFLYSIEIANLLGISYISPNEVLQSPQLLKQQ